MMHVDMVYGLPTWLQAVLLVGCAVIGAFAIELTARRLVGGQVRQQHNEVAAAMFGVIGVTFAVLLAFVVMLTFEGFGTARTAAASEAAAVRGVADAADALQAPVRSGVRAGLSAYLHAVIEREWPAQADGHFDAAASVPLRALMAESAAYRPAGPSETPWHVALVSGLVHLQETRAMRQAAADTKVPSIVWVVMLLGGTLTVVAGSFLGSSSLGMHMTMSATLAASGALVVVLIVALSQPFRGEFRVSTTPFERVLSDLDAGR